LVAVIYRRRFGWQCAVLLALWLPAETQQPKKMYWIGLLTVGSLSSKAHRLETLSQGLRAFGHVEGKNISIDRRAAAYVDNILKGQKAC
jgi:hypothetical protein